MPISLSDNPLLTQNSYPLSPWPLYGRKYESLNSRHNFFMQGFKPGIPLQAAELNEIQEHHYLNQSLSLNFFTQWRVYKGEDEATIQELTGDSLRFLEFPNINYHAYPLFKNNQIDISVSSDNVTLILSPGWYVFPINSVAHWVCLFESKFVSGLVFSEEERTFYLKIDYRLEECSENQSDVGYFFNDRSNRTINPITNGADRIEVEITSVENEQMDNTIALCTVEHSENNFYLRSMNNYLMQTVTIE
jgi:hypothetical protein